MFTTFFHDLYITDVDVDGWIQTGHSYPQIEESYMCKLNKDLKHEEIKKSIFYIAPWKSP